LFVHIRLTKADGIQMTTDQQHSVIKLAPFLLGMKLIIIIIIIISHIATKLFSV